MKKLMIACAVAAMTAGAFAAGCGDDDPDPDPVTVNQVYKMTFSGKTTNGVPGKDVVTSVFCGDDDVQDGCVVRVPANLKIEGWVVLCNITCATIVDVFNAPQKQAYWTTKPYKADIPDGKATFTIINVIGKKGKDPYVPPPKKNIEDTMHAFIEKHEAINNQIVQTLNNLKDTFVKFTSVLAIQEKCKFPA